MSPVPRVSLEGMYYYLVLEKEGGRERKEGESGEGRKGGTKRGREEERKRTRKRKKGNCIRIPEHFEMAFCV